VGWLSFFKLKEFVFFQIFKFVVVAISFLCLPFWYFTFLVFALNPVFQKDASNFGVVMVLGAGIINGSEPSIVLEKRLDKVVELYKLKKVKKVLVTGDNREVYYNEPLAMKTYLVKSGIPGSDIIQDFAGRRTIDSCWRAKNVFKLNRLILVTQPFHLARSNYLCKSVGLEVKAISSENGRFRVTAFGILREIPATWLAVTESFNYNDVIAGNGNEPNLGVY